MNSFEQNDKIQSELVQTIKNLQLIVENNQPFSTIEKDILLQCLRKLYLLTLKYTPQDTTNCDEQIAAKIAESVEKTPKIEPRVETKVNDLPTPEPVAEKPIEVEEPVFEDLFHEEEPAEVEEKTEEKESEDKPIQEMFDDAEEVIDFLAPKAEENEPDAPEKLEPKVKEVEKEEPEVKQVDSAEQNSGLLFAEDEMQKAAQPAPKRSLNDLLNEQKKDNSLVDKLRQSKVDDLSKAISLNDKFLYIKELFQNKGGDFSNAIQTLNKCETMEDAQEELELLQKYYSWDTTTAAYTSFYDLVSRKFQ